MNILLYDFAINYFILLKIPNSFLLPKYKKHFYHRMEILILIHSNDNILYQFTTKEIQKLLQLEQNKIKQTSEKNNKLVTKS